MIGILVLLALASKRSFHDEEITDFKFMSYFHSRNIFLDSLMYCIFICGVLLTFLLPFWLFGTGITDFACVRSLEGVECNLVRRSRLFKVSEVKIHHPIVVDLSQDKSGRKRIVPITRAEIRSENVSYKTNIYYGYDRETARNIAKEINEFLLSSNAPSFHKRF